LVEKKITKIMFLVMKVEASSFVTSGTPVIRVDKSGYFFIGRDFKMNNGYRANIIGRQQKCIFIVGPNAELTIGAHVGISSTAIVCRKKIVIEDHVLIGGNTVIYDTDFHPLNSADRINSPEKQSPLIKNKAVRIKRNAFVGAHTTILKGVTIGERSIVGAGSVVTRDIPADEIWGGNPAYFIKNL
jgi:acetyltransferase-like isoleucine patch superfamily enzyme